MNFIWVHRHFAHPCGLSHKAFKLVCLRPVRLSHPACTCAVAAAESLLHSAARDLPPHRETSSISGFFQAASQGSRELGLPPAAPLTNQNKCFMFVVCLRRSLLPPPCHVFPGHVFQCPRVPPCPRVLRLTVSPCLRVSPLLICFRGINPNQFLPRPWSTKCHLTQSPTW